MSARRPLVEPLVLLALASTAQGQHEHQPSGWVASGMVQAVPLLTRATPTVHGRSLTEAYLAQPVVAGNVSGFGGRLAALGMLNLEGVTLARGELSTGTYGEGFVDRRHPHSYVHELLVTASGELGASGRGISLSLTGGRGFAPFGSDDSMTRPFAKYPVNHHLAQILERIVLIAAARVGPLTLEGAAFNGDEPSDPSSVPVWSRFADSWAARATLRPFRAVELVASAARVESPEFREGLGLDQRKRSVVLRVEQPVAGGARSRYLLAEWARTHDDRRGQLAFTYSSFLAEAAYCGRGLGAVRFERTTRPEEERRFDPFRTRRPQMEFAILGRTRWTTVTAAAGTSGRGAGVVTISPFVEATYARPEAVEERAAFAPRDFYGSQALWLLSVGARVSVGSRHRRMGRYGVAADAAPHARESAVPAHC